MFRFLSLLFAFGLFVLAIVGLAGSGKIGIGPPVMLFVVALAFFGSWQRLRSLDAMQSEASELRLADGTRISELVGRSWEFECQRVEKASEVLGDVAGVAWIASSGLRKVRIYSYKIGVRVVRFSVADGRIRKITVEPTNE